MKFNYKKIATVIGSALMVGSTIGIAAAAAYPAPFVSSGVADVAVVVGANAALSDAVAATSIGSNLATKLAEATTTSTTGSATASGGDSIKIEKASTKLNLYDGLTDVWGTSITKTDLKTLLADGIFNNKQNSEYKYTQKFDIANLNFTQFSDSDYNDRVPGLGTKLNINDWVANYTLSFNTQPEATQSADLTDFENKNIVIMGKNYYILDFKNSTAKMTLLDSATSTSLIEGESKTVTMGTTTYDVSINFISTDEVILTVNGENSEKLSATGTTYGNTYKLSDGTYVGIKTINVQNYAGGSKSVDFSLGKGKLEISHGSNVKLNDKSVADLYGYVYLVDGSKRKWQKLVIEWKVSDKRFLSPTKELSMPGFEAIKFTEGEPTLPAKEKIIVDYSGSDAFELKVPIKSGDATIPLLYMASTSVANYSGIGKSATQRLATSNMTTMWYNASGNWVGFIASWNNSRDAESYYLKAKITQDSDTKVNYTEIYDNVAQATVCEGLDPTGTTTCTLGNVVLTVGATRYDQRGVNLSINGGGSFNRLYSKEGMTIYLPWSNVTSINGGDVTAGPITGLKGAFSPTADIDVDKGNGPNKWTLWMAEEDKNGNLGYTNIQVNLTIGGSSSFQATASQVGYAAVLGSGSSTSGFETKTSSKLWEAYNPTDLATKIIHDQSNSNQYRVDLEYHGGEVYGNVFVSAPSVTVSSTGAGGTATELGQITVTDAEITSASSKNLIVIGGSCINSVAAKVLGKDAPVCGAEFTTLTGVEAGQYLIKAVKSPYNEAKVAMLVAGFNAEDTTIGVRDLINNAASYEAVDGKTYKGTSTTIATAVTTTA